MGDIEKENLDINLTGSLYKYFLGVPVGFSDIEVVDQEYATNMRWILENDITDLALDLTFSAEADQFGTMVKVDLKPQGSSTFVTEQNKAEYISLLAEFKTTGAVKQQINQILFGISQLIDVKLLRIFTPHELALLVSGTNEISVDDWRKHSNYYSFKEDDIQVQWFWQIVSEFNNDERAMLLQFSTGSPRLPPGGFKELKGATGDSCLFTLTKGPEGGGSLPTASTCFNLFKLPCYESLEVTRKKIQIALLCGARGFEFR